MVTDLHFDWIGQSYPDNRPTELLVPAEMGVRPVWNADGGNGWGAVIETPILGGVEIAGCSHSHPDVATAWDCATVMARNIAERVIAHQCSGSTAPIRPM